MRTMFKETKQKSVRGIKAGAGETRDAKERQNAEQTHKQTKGASLLPPCGGKKKKKLSSLNKCARVTHESARLRKAGEPVEAESLVVSFDLKSSRPLLQLIAARPKHAAAAQIR